MLVTGQKKFESVCRINEDLMDLKWDENLLWFQKEQKTSCGFERKRIELETQLRLKYDKSRL